MEVILNQDIDKLGKAGSVVKVKDGFARNFLIARNLAVPVTPANLKKLEKEKERLTQEVERAKTEAQEKKARLDVFSLTIQALVKEEDKLYAPIDAHDIASGLKDEGFEVEKRLILLDEPIKSLGIYEVPVKLHPEVTAKIKVWIVKK